MHVIWKRPDGFHGAGPEDFYVLNLGGHSRLWLHRGEQEWFPFKISGDWGDDESTKKLNGLINRLNKSPQEWCDYLNQLFSKTMKDDAKTFIEDMTKWVASLKDHLKGDKWELDIMVQTLTEVERHLNQAKEKFLKMNA